MKFIPRKTIGIFTGTILDTMALALGSVGSQNEMPKVNNTKN